MRNKENNKIIAQYISHKNYRKIEVANFLEEVEQIQQLKFIPWKKYPYIPDVKFKIAHTDQSILLKVFVKENYIRAKYNRPNDPVFKDSCFEFFISLDYDHNYYNFEYNCIGTPYLAYGKPGNNRIKSSAEILNSIQTLSTLGNKTFEEKKGDLHWELNINIPFSAFFAHNIKSLNGISCSANFYKCGDELTSPHFVSWNNINTVEPDFHRPEYFGELRFN